MDRSSTCAGLFRWGTDIKRRNGRSKRIIFLPLHHATLRRSCHTRCLFTAIPPPACTRHPHPPTPRRRAFKAHPRSPICSNIAIPSFLPDPPPDPTSETPAPVSHTPSFADALLMPQGFRTLAGFSENCACCFQSSAHAGIIPHCTHTAHGRKQRCPGALESIGWNRKAAEARQGKSTRVQRASSLLEPLY
jgi:hypothetical protein